MNLLAEIQRTPDVNVHGRTIHRLAVRAVILRGRDLLMIHSTNVGDYKFPGGGVNTGESHAQALRREVAEESGRSITSFGSEIGTIIEYDIPVEQDYDVFQMDSHYYLCEVADSTGAQTLDDYEQELGFQAVWIGVDRAIQLNKNLLHAAHPPVWLRREIFLLNYIQENMVPAAGT